MFDTLSERLSETLRRVAGKATLSEDNIKDTLREVRQALLEADVALPVVKDFIEQVRERALGQEVMKSLSPGQAFLRIVQLEDIGLHYATTLACWRDNFFANLDQVRALGYPESFIRMWEYYFCYCEAGFAERVIGDVQMLLVKPGNRRTPV